MKEGAEGFGHMALNNIIELREETFASEVLSSCVPVLVDFWAGWCQPCRILLPMLEDLATEYEGQVKFAKVDVEKHSVLAAEYRISGVPTLILFKDGEVEDVIVGLKSKRDLKASLENALTPA